jgi:hypothetical protein
VRAAARTEPSRATSTKVLSWVSVTGPSSPSPRDK